MVASIQLLRLQASNNGTSRQHAWPVVIRAKGTNISSDIFVYRVGKDGDPIPGDAFSCVASAIEMDELPRDRALALTAKYQFPFYRTSQMEVLCSSPEEAEYVWQIAKEDTQCLLDNYNTLVTNTVNASTILSSTVVSDNIINSEPEPGVTLSTFETVTIPAGMPVIAQSTPPNASYANSIWLKTEPVTGKVLQAFSFFAASAGGDNNWHSRVTSQIGQSVSTEDLVVAPGI